MRRMGEKRRAGGGTIKCQLFERQRLLLSIGQYLNRPNSQQNLGDGAGQFVHTKELFQHDRLSNVCNHAYAFS